MNNVKSKICSIENRYDSRTLQSDKRSSKTATAAPYALKGRSRVRTILAPTDLSAASEAGVRYALSAGRELGAEVIVYNVITRNEIAVFGRRRTKDKLVAPHRGLIEIYEKRLRNFVERNFADAVTSVKVKQKVEFGTPETAIIETAKAEGADLVIMATRGMSGLSRMLSGSVTEQVIRNAPCPVVAIPSSFTIADQDLYSAVG
jgi:nucleotide-binding universal stress UspA family protein